MAKASTDSATSEKRAPRKRAPRTTARVAASSSGEARTETRRKAPTTISISAQGSGRSYKAIYVPLAILTVGFGIAFAIGYSDKGQINITGVINERNAKVIAGEAVEGESGTNSQVVPVQVDNGLIDGGLVGAGVSTPAPAPEPIPEETASSTDETASSTESAGDESAESGEISEGEVPSEVQ